MAKSKFDKIIDSYLRKGLVGKVDYLRKLDSLILSSHKKMIQENNKAVLREIILPKWLEWEILVAWANKDIEDSSKCLFCKKSTEIEYKNKPICPKCIEAIKKLIK